MTNAYELGEGDRCANVRRTALEVAQTFAGRGRPSDQQLEQHWLFYLEGLGLLEPMRQVFKAARGKALDAVLTPEEARDFDCAVMQSDYARGL